MGSKVIQISILGRVYGNVNADEVIGQRITLKKMYSSGGEVFPFVSARAIKRAIREALKEKGYKVDEFEAGKERTLALADTGRPDELIDNDLFGYMVTGKNTYSRQGPVAMSYFKALKDTPIKSEFGGRFPRTLAPGSNPVPFEVEVADFIGRLNVLIYDYIGDFTNPNENPDIPEDKRILDIAERRKRLGDFLEVLLLPKYVLPRRTNSLNIPEYIGSLLAFSKVGPLPVYTYHRYDFDEDSIDFNSLSKLSKFKEMYGDDVEFLYILYIDGDGGAIDREIFTVVDVSDAVEKAVDFMFPSG